MKPLSIRIFKPLILLLFSSVSYGAEALLGGDCGEYDVTIEEAELVSIQKDTENHYKIVFKSDNKMHGSWYVTVANKVGFEEKKPYKLKVETSRGGTCTPMIISLLDYPQLTLKYLPNTKQNKANIKSDNSWKLFSSPSSYSNSSYTLRADIDYFELRKYLFSRKTGERVSDKYIPYLQIYRKALSSYPQKIVRRFKKTSFNHEDETDIKAKNPNSPHYQFKVKGFIIKKDNKIWTINEQKDMVWLFDKIDTEAELYWFMKINELFGEYVSKNSYKKPSIGYDVKQIQIQYKVEKETEGKQDFYTSYEIHDTYIYHIKPNGEYKKEFISKARKNEKKEKVNTDFHGDPMFVIPMSLEEILKNKDFITP